MVKKGGYRRVQESSFGYESSHSSYGSSYSSYGSYAVPARKPQTKRVESAMVASQKAAYLDLNQGDMVMHAAFGKGMVLSVMKMGGDALLEIAFDDIGTKKLMAKTASVHMKKL